MDRKIIDLAKNEEVDDLVTLIRELYAPPLTAAEYSQLKNNIKQRVITTSGQSQQASSTWLTSNWALALGSIAASLVLVVAVISLSTVGQTQTTVSNKQIEQSNVEQKVNKIILEDSEIAPEPGTTPLPLVSCETASPDRELADPLQKVENEPDSQNSEFTTNPDDLTCPDL